MVGFKSDMIAVDVHYQKGGPATAAAVMFSKWEDEEASFQDVMVFPHPEEYVPGKFYLRELPCIVPLIEKIGKISPLDKIIVDAYVDLEKNRPGLGRHLQRALGDGIEIIGVAKTLFKNAPSRPVYRGTSKRPLYVSSTGDIEEACQKVAQMAGSFRIPALLKRVDQLARGYPAHILGFQIL
jgi:deoxyribonuclease V